MTTEAEELELDDQWRTPRRWPWIVGAVVGVTLLGVGLFFFAQPPEATPEAKRLVEKGYAALWRDSHDQFAVADVALQAALVESPTAALTLAAYAELELRWAEALRGDRDARFAPPDYDVHLKRGEEATLKAQRTEPDLRATRRALAQLYRLRDPPEKAAARELFAHEPEPLSATAHYELGVTAMLPPADVALAIRHLEQAVKLEPELLRIRYDLARALLIGPRAREDKAIAQLDVLLRANPRHRRAAALRGGLFAMPAPEPEPVE